MTRQIAPPKAHATGIDTLIGSESKRLRGCFLINLLANSTIVAALYAEIILLWKTGPQEVSELWPGGLDPLAVGLAITSLTVAMVIAVGVARFPSLSAVQEGKETVDAYVRGMHLMQTTRLVAGVSGLILLILVPLLASGGGYHIICAVAFTLLALLCFRLSCAVPVPITDWERDIEEQKFVLGKVDAESRRLQSKLDARGGLVTHPRRRFGAWVILSSLVITGVLAVGIITHLQTWASSGPNVLFKLVVAGVILGGYIQGMVVWGFSGFPAPQYNERSMAWFRAIMFTLGLLVLMGPPISAARYSDLTGILSRYLLTAIVLYTVSAMLAVCYSPAFRTLRHHWLEKRRSEVHERLDSYEQFHSARKLPHKEMFTEGESRSTANAAKRLIYRMTRRCPGSSPNRPSSDTTPS